MTLFPFGTEIVNCQIQLRNLNTVALNSEIDSSLIPRNIPLIDHTLSTYAIKQIAMWTYIYYALNKPIKVYQHHTNRPKNKHIVAAIR